MLRIEYVRYDNREDMNDVLEASHLKCDLSGIARKAGFSAKWVPRLRKQESQRSSTRAFSLLVDTGRICEVRLFLGKTRVPLPCLVSTGSENALMRVTGKLHFHDQPLSGAGMTGCFTAAY